MHFVLLKRKRENDLKYCLHLKRFYLTRVGDMGSLGSIQVNTVLKDPRRVSMNSAWENLWRFHIGVTFELALKRVQKGFLGEKGEGTSQTKEKACAKAQKHFQNLYVIFFPFFCKHSDFFFSWTQYKKCCLGFQSSLKFFINYNVSKTLN